MFFQNKLFILVSILFVFELKKTIKTLFQNELPKKIYINELAVKKTPMLILLDWSKNLQEPRFLHLKKWNFDLYVRKMLEDVSSQKLGKGELPPAFHILCMFTWSIDMDVCAMQKNAYFAEENQSLLFRAFHCNQFCSSSGVDFTIILWAAFVPVDLRPFFGLWLRE